MLCIAAGLVLCNISFAADEIPVKKGVASDANDMVRAAEESAD